MPGDVISVRVWNQESVSGRVRVRPDGKVSIPFLNDIEAGGLTPQLLSKRLQVRLKEFVVDPVVTVTLEERRPIQISMLGEVARRGSFELEPGSGMLQALAIAGGLTEFAHGDQIFLVRNSPTDGKTLRIRFDYDSLTRAQGRGPAFRLQSGDVIVVE